MIMRRLTAWRIVLWAVPAVFTTATHAHDMNMTSVKVLLDEKQVTVSVVAHLHDLKTDDPSAEIASRLKLRLDDKPFSPRHAQLMRDAANGIVIWQAKQPGAAAVVAVEAPIFPERKAESTIVTVIKDRQVLDEAVLDANHPSAIIGRISEPAKT